MDIDEVVARESIRDLVTRYNSLGDAGRIDEMMHLFHEDALLEVPGQAQLSGKPAIEAFFRSVAETATVATPLRSLQHHTATHRIDLQGSDSARGYCYFTVYTQDGLDHWGRYRDTYRRSGGHWLFLSRSVTLDGVVPGGWADSRNQGAS